MALSLINVYVLLRHGKTITIGVVPPKDPAYGKQYKLWVDTSTTNGKDLAAQIANVCGSPPITRTTDTPALYYFSNVAPLDKVDGVEFMQTAIELRVRGLPNIMDGPPMGGVPVWGSSLLEDKQVNETGLIFCQTFRYRY